MNEWWFKTRYRAVLVVAWFLGIRKDLPPLEHVLVSWRYDRGYCRCELCRRD